METLQADSTKKLNKFKLPRLGSIMATDIFKVIEFEKFKRSKNQSTVEIRIDQRS